MFERMTDRACLCLESARQMARELGHETVEVEHILLGLLKETAGIACAALREAAVDLETLREELERRLPSGRDQAEGGVEFSPAAGRMFERSLAEAKRCGHDYLGTEHLMLGILSGKTGAAVQMLKELGPGLGKLRKHVLSFIVPAEGLSEAPGEQAEVEKPEDTGGGTTGSDELPAPIQERATQRVHKCIQNARREAARQGLDEVGSEHLLLGMLRDENGVACSVLKKLGLDFESIREELSRSPSSGTVFEAPTRFASDAVQVLDESLAEAKALDHEYVGTEHLLLGLLRVADAEAARALRERGFDYRSTREEILRVLGLEVSPTLPAEDFLDEPPMDLGFPEPDLDDLGLSPEPHLAPSGEEAEEPRDLASGAQVKTSYSKEAADLIARIHAIEEEKQEAIREEKFERAGELRDESFRLTEELEASVKGTHTVTHAFNDETVDAILRMMDTYWRMKSEGVERSEIVEWLKTSFFRLPGFVIPKPPPNRPPPEEPEE